MAVCAAPSAAADSCPPLKRLTTLELTPLRSGVVTVPVTFGNETFPFVLDTSAGQSRISTALAQRLHIPREHSSVTLVNGKGKTAETLAVPSELVLGNLVYSSPKLREMIDTPAPDAPQGVVGSDLLRNYDVDLDFAAKKMNLISRDHCEGHVVYWQFTTLAKIPMVVDDRNHIVFEMMLDGHTLTTVLATGQAHSALNRNVAKEVFDIDGTSPGSVAVNPNDPDTLYHHRFGTLSADGISISSPDILLVRDIADALPGYLTRGRGHFLAKLNIGQPDLMLGMSTLKQLHVYIDYHYQRIYLTPNAAPVAAPTTTATP
jgi:hypothetical protein